MKKQDPAAVAALSSLVPGGWEAIQAAQQGRPTSAPIDLTKPAKRPATDKDRALLAQHGAAGLRKLGLFGPLDRLDLPFTDETDQVVTRLGADCAEGLTK